MNFFRRGNQKTFRPRKGVAAGKQAELQDHLYATLGSGNLREVGRFFAWKEGESLDC